MKKFYVVVLTLLSSWAIMTCCDFHDQKIHTKFAYPALFVIPVLCIILYTVYRNKIYYNKPAIIREIIFLCGLWFGIGTVLAINISFIMDEDIWYVIHKLVSSDRIFNGIEYPLFGIIITFVPFAYAIILEAMVALRRKVRSKNS